MGANKLQTNPERGNDDAYIGRRSIEAFFAESVILLTGATGFLGKALLEKLLRSCPSVATIFILIRPRQGQTVEQRFKNLLENSIFDKIRTDCPDMFNKIYPVKGDVTLPNLDLTPEDRYMLTQRVTIVYHSAATVRFNEPLKVAVNLNTKGTDRVIDLCKDMLKLISIIHVSTAYSNADRHDVDETVYMTKVKPSTVIDMCESLDDVTLQMLEKKILEDHPNTYTYTKNLAEQIVVTKAEDLPISIVRPSIICAAQEEPFPGWVDNLCGITGVLMEIGRGTLRSVICDPNLQLNIVPIDYVVDTIICASWYNTIQRNNTVRVYNCTTSVDTIRWGYFKNMVKKHAIEYPSKQVMWYPGTTFRTNKFVHNVVSVLLHFFPAFIVDFILKLLGSKPIMVKIVKKFERAVVTGAFFATHEWTFKRSNMEHLTKEVGELRDSDQFNTNMHDFDWDTYVRNYTLGIRKFILKENPENVSEARNRLLILYWLHRITQISGIIILLTIIRRVG